MVRRRGRALGSHGATTAACGASRSLERGDSGWTGSLSTASTYCPCSSKGWVCTLKLTVHQRLFRHPPGAAGGPGADLPEPAAHRARGCVREPLSRHAAAASAALHLQRPAPGGILIPAFQAAVLGYSLNAGAYIAEIIRAAIQSIDRGQMEAARSLGMSYGLAMRRIILPQTYRRLLAAHGERDVGADEGYLPGLDHLHPGLMKYPMQFVSPHEPGVADLRVDGGALPRGHHEPERALASRLEKSWRRGDSMAEPIIVIEGLKKSFGKLEVLRGIDLTVRRARSSSSSARAARARPRCCAASTSWSSPPRAGSARRGAGRATRQRRPAGAAARDAARRAAGPHRHGVPALQPVPAHDGAGERHRGARSRCSGMPRAEAEASALRLLGAGRAWPTRPTRTPASFPAGSSSGWPSPGPWPWSPT